MVKIIWDEYLLIWSEYFGSEGRRWPTDFEVFIKVLKTHLISDIMNTFCNLEDWKMSGRAFLHAIKVLYSLRLQKNLDKNPRCVFLHPDPADVFGFNKDISQ